MKNHHFNVKTHQQRRGDVHAQVVPGGESHRGLARHRRRRRLGAAGGGDQAQREQQPAGRHAAVGDAGRDFLATTSASQGQLVPQLNCPREREAKRAAGNCLRQPLVLPLVEPRKLLKLPTRRGAAAW